MNEDLLETWKDFACYLKCSVRKAQTPRTAAPADQTHSEYESGVASKTEIDQWLNHQSPRVTESLQSHERMASLRFPGQPWVLAASERQSMPAFSGSAF